MDIIDELIEVLEKGNVTYQEAITYSMKIQNDRARDVIQYAIHKHFREELSNAK